MGNHGKMMGKPWENDGFIWFSMGSDGMLILWFHQTWLENPRSESGGRKITDKLSIFQHTMFDETGGYINPELDG